MEIKIYDTEVKPEKKKMLTLSLRGNSISLIKVWVNNAKCDNLETAFGGSN